MEKESAKTGKSTLIEEVIIAFDGVAIVPTRCATCINALSHVYQRVEPRVSTRWYT